MDKERQGALLRNRLLNEIVCYESVIGDMTVYPGEVSNVADTLARRANIVIREIVNLYDSYRGRADAEAAFIADHPDLKDVVTQLAAYQPDVAGNFMMSDLRMMGRNVKAVTIPSTSSPSPALAVRGNVFSKFMP